MTKATAIRGADDTSSAADWAVRPISTPAGSTLGFAVDRFLPEHCIMLCAPIPAACEAGTRRLHPGAMVILADQCLGQVAIGVSRAPFVTLNLRMDWFHPPSEGEALACEARLLQRQGDVVHVAAELVQGGHRVAMASGQFVAGIAAGGSKQGTPRPDAPPSLPEPASFEEFLALEHRDGGHHLPIRTHHIGSPFLPALHGGVIATALQQAMSAEVAATDPQARKALITSSTQFLLAGRANEPSVIRTSWIRNGQRVAMLQAEAFQSTNAKPYAVAQAIFAAPRVD